MPAIAERLSIKASPTCMHYGALARRTDAKYLGNLASIFNGPFIRRLSDTSLLRDVLEGSGVLGPSSELPTIGDVFDFSYAVLQARYRCEYLYKNAIAAKVLLGRHSAKTAALLTEVAVADCKADLVLVNGTSVAYEIKTELDSLDRLPSQLQAYASAFDKVFVVTYESCVERLEKFLPVGVGLLAMTNRYTLTTIKESDSYRERIDPSIVFDILRRSEYVPIICRQFGFVPDVPNTLIYSKCRELFLKLDSATVHAELTDALRERGRPPINDAVETAPHSLKLHALTGEFGPQHYQILRSRPEDVFF